MHRLRKLIPEIHRRSVCQVLSAYLGVSWLGLGLVDPLTNVVGLPDWTSKMASVLLMIELPIVTAPAADTLPFRRP